MKRIVLPTAVGLLAGALWYPGFAFLTWDWNPGNWEWILRLFCIILAVGTAGLTGSALYEKLRKLDVEASWAPSKVLQEPPHGL